VEAAEEHHLHLGETTTPAPRQSLVLGRGLATARRWLVVATASL
jgi:hypothetical protein